MNLTGRKDTPSLIDGYEMGIVFVEEITRYSEVYPLKTNNIHEIRKAIDRWNTELMSYQHSWYKDIKDFLFYLRAENLELDYPTINDYVESVGLVSQLSAPEQSSSNGLAERAIKTTDEMSRTMRHARNPPKDFWAWSFTHAIFIRNRIPISINGVMCRDLYQAFFGHIFDYSKLRIFRSAC